MGSISSFQLVVLGSNPAWGMHMEFFSLAKTFISFIDIKPTAPKLTVVANDLDVDATIKKKNIQIITEILQIT